MAKKSKVSEEDIDAFRKAVADVSPLKKAKNKIRLSAPKHTKIIRAQKQEEDAFHLSESDDLPTVSPDTFLSFKQPAISNKTLRKLRKGQYNVEAILDLHGKTVEAARKAISSFLNECLENKVRVALIIHGKSRYSQLPVLKNKLNHWLRNINVVLAFCSASSTHGRSGAIYVLLKDINGNAWEKMSE